MSEEEGAAIATTRIRPATPDDAEAILAIYAPIIRETVISFEYEVPSIDEMRRRIDAIIVDYPWLLCEIGGEVAGYAYASRHRERQAYGWSADTSVYVGEPFRGQGVGRALYADLFERLRHQGVCTIFAGITLPNPASERLHRSLGFVDVGVYRNVGYKFGAWHDVAWFQMPLNEEMPSDPAPLKGPQHQSEER